MQIVDMKTKIGRLDKFTSLHMEEAANGLKSVQFRSSIKIKTG